MTDADRLARLERKVDFILEHLGLEYAENDLEGVQGLVREGRMIDAIKAYRELNPGTGLKEAKEAVEAIQRELGG